MSPSRTASIAQMAVADARQSFADVTAIASTTDGRAALQTLMIDITLLSMSVRNVLHLLGAPLPSLATESV